MCLPKIPLEKKKKRRRKVPEDEKEESSEKMNMTKLSSDSIKLSSRGGYLCSGSSQTMSQSRLSKDPPLCEHT